MLLRAIGGIVGTRRVLGTAVARGGREQAVKFHSGGSDAVSEDLVQLVESAAREVAERDGLQLPDDFGADSPLFGRHGVFDSLGLVGLIVAVEEAISDRFELPVSLADERALSQSRSPFRTVGSLAEYARGLIDDSDG